MHEMALVRPEFHAAASEARQKGGSTSGADIAGMVGSAGVDRPSFLFWALEHVGISKRDETNSTGQDRPLVRAQDRDRPQVRRRVLADLVEATWLHPLLHRWVCGRVRAHL